MTLHCVECNLHIIYPLISNNRNTDLYAQIIKKSIHTTSILAIFFLICYLGHKTDQTYTVHRAFSFDFGLYSHILMYTPIQHIVNWWMMESTVASCHKTKTQWEMDQQSIPTVNSWLSEISLLAKSLQHYTLVPLVPGLIPRPVQLQCHHIAEYVPDMLGIDVWWPGIGVIWMSMCIICLSIILMWLGIGSMFGYGPYKSLYKCHNISYGWVWIAYGWVWASYGWVCILWS